ncbi:MAG: 50S ribosomal protein L18 [Alphaproteobacteria bacterium]|nr:50S ribosomal protein L18 [Alphaproteobacteria bacterium]MDE2336246.1 50S ribosomal protein L18 [Alphaproteobacteria bacterium]
MKTTSKQRRQWRVRKAVKHATEKNNRPRLSVYRSAHHIYAQVINDATGLTLAAASTMDVGLKKSLKSTHDKDAAAAVGKLVAERAKKAGVEQVAFDRGSYMYHGRVKALAEAAREAGLSF